MESSDSLAPEDGATEGAHMSKRPRDPDMPVGKLTIIPNFLPPPDKLIFKEDGIKVTLSLSKYSVEFFKHEAAKIDAPYQRMIRNLLDAYVAKHRPAKAVRSKRAR